ncbi:YktB family protein [Massilibacterium senegalense]|uniref:YktB family protein n=1 Tax=Massilibacterium senegalense TaxID=1632858 RepID=UPI000780EADD|nr:DUF1054 domain-containing protein [Massilibacterium senegalense]
MNFTGFSPTDFQIFTMDGLDERMAAIKSDIRPNLEALGEIFAKRLTEKTNETMYYHVAKHARRKVNPPNDTWVAFSTNKRGYKALPHFQIGLFETHVFIWFAIIYEAPIKKQYGSTVKEHVEDILSHIPQDFVWSIDHMKPEAIAHHTVTEEKLTEMANRLQNVKKAELLCGMHINRQDPILQTPEQFVEKVDETFTTLLPLYTLASRI